MFKVLLFIFCASLSQASTCLDLLKNSELTHRNMESHIQYITFEGVRIPYVDLKPKGKIQGTIFLVSGFSKNMNSWMPQLNSLTSKGYRVISFDQSNVGRNLRENGLIDLAFGKGFSYDTKLAVQVLKKLRPEKLVIAGHSRGARLAVEIGVSLRGLRKPPVQIEKVVLMSPYTNYSWQSTLPGAAGFYTDAWTDFTLSWNPSAIGRAMGANLKRNPSEDVEGLSDSSREAALGYILKGTKPSSVNGELGTLHFLEKLLDRNTPVKVIVSDSEEFFTPLSDVRELDVKGVDFRVLEGSKFTHYWPGEHLNVFLEGLLGSN